MKIISITSLITLFFFGLVFTMACCKRPPTPPLHCPTNQVWTGNDCVCNQNSYWNGTDCINLGTDVSNTPTIYVTIGNNCGDWRDSLFIPTSQFDQTRNSFFLDQLPSNGMTWGGDSWAYISFYNEQPIKDTFGVVSSIMQYHAPAIRGDKNYAIFGSINKAKDTIWTHIFDVSTEPYTLSNGCDKIFVKVK